MILHLLLYLIVLYFGLSHIHSPYGQMIVAGSAMNGTEFVLNDFKMPSLGYTTDPFYTPMSTSTVLPILADDFYFMIYKPNFSVSFSIGDVLIATGIWNIIFGDEKK